MFVIRHLGQCIVNTRQLTQCTGPATSTPHAVFEIDTNERKRKQCANSKIGKTSDLLVCNRTPVSQGDRLPINTSGGCRRAVHVAPGELTQCHISAVSQAVYQEELYRLLRMVRQSHYSCGALACSVFSAPKIIFPSRQLLSSRQALSTTYPLDKRRRAT